MGTREVVEGLIFYMRSRHDSQKWPYINLDFHFAYGPVRFGPMRSVRFEYLLLVSTLWTGLRGLATGIPLNYSSVERMFLMNSFEAMKMARCARQTSHYAT